LQLRRDYEAAWVESSESIKGFMAKPYTLYNIHVKLAEQRFAGTANFPPAC
jgi:hypothetical protein